MTAVERAARIIAAHAQPYTDWDDLTEKWQDKTRECARQVVEVLYDEVGDPDATEPAGIAL